MVLSKDELIDALKQEVRILVHLAGKVDSAQIGYRPTATRALSGWSEADFRGEIDMFGRRFSRGSMIVNLVICGHAAYRTQLFLYLKSCGRDDLDTMNLWGGADRPPKGA